MALNPKTLDSVELVLAHARNRPGNAFEQALTAGIVRLAPRELPLDPAVVGEALIQAALFTNSLIDHIRELDPLLDWESTTTVAVNILTFAGVELFTGGTTS